MLCWAGTIKTVKGVHYYSRVDIELINEQVRLFYSALDEITIDYNDDYFKLIHDDSRNIGNHITGEVIDNVTTSPPYFSMKLYLEDDVNVKGSGRRNLKTKQIGQENTIPKYIDSLMDVLTEVNNVLKETGSVFINVMDSSIDGITQRIPDKLINAYEKSGVTFVQYI